MGPSEDDAEGFLWNRILSLAGFEVEGQETGASVELDTESHGGGGLDTCNRLGEREVGDGRHSGRVMTTMMTNT